MLPDPGRSFMEALVEGELKTADLVSSLGPFLASLVSIAATTLFKLAVILSAKAVFLWGLKKATLHKSTVIHVKVGLEKAAMFNRPFDSQAADIVLGGDHLEDYWGGEGGYSRQDDYLEEEDFDNYGYTGNRYSDVSGVNWKQG